MWTDFASAPTRVVNRLRRLVPPAQAPAPPFLKGSTAFILHYVGARRWRFAALFAMVLGAAGCAVGVQYIMKLLVDAMAGPRQGNDAVWMALTLFISLTAMESVLWRISG